MAIENNNPNFSGYFIADVLEVDRSERRVSVYIPKFMPGMPGGSQISSSIITTTNPNITGLNYNTTIKVRNSIWVYPWNFDDPLPKVGSKVAVFFMDGNPKTGYWEKFNPNNNYEVIDDERYPKLLDLNFSGSSVTVNTDDNLTIEFPSNYTSVYNEDGKNKTIRVLQRENYVVSEEEPSDPFNGLMWFKESTQDAFIYKNGTFKRIIFEEDLQSLYSQVETISRTFEDQIKSSRFLFSSSLSKIADPIEGQIVVIDSTQAESGFYKYTILEPFLIAATATVDSGITGNGTTIDPWIGTISGLTSAQTANVVIGQTGDIIYTTTSTARMSNKTEFVVTSKTATTITYRAIGWDKPVSGSITNLYRYADLTKDGYYQFSRTNIFESIFLGEEKVLEAYKYTNGQWTELDGWFYWNQATSGASLGDFAQGQSHNISAGSFKIYNMDSLTYLLKITRVYEPSLTISANTSVDFQMYATRYVTQCDTTAGSNTITDIPVDMTKVVKAGDYLFDPSGTLPMRAKVVTISWDSVSLRSTITLDKNALVTANNTTLHHIILVGEKATLVNTAGAYSITPSYYFTTGIPEIPDIDTRGVVVGNLRCWVSNPGTTSTTMNFGTGMTIEAESNIKII
jgi:hypothetical protein